MEWSAVLAILLGVSGCLAGMCRTRDDDADGPNDRGKAFIIVIAFLTIATVIVDSNEKRALSTQITNIENAASTVESTTEDIKTVTDENKNSIGESLNKLADTSNKIDQQTTTINSDYKAQLESTLSQLKSTNQHADFLFMVSMIENKHSRCKRVAEQLNMAVRMLDGMRSVNDAKPRAWEDLAIEVCRTARKATGDAQKYLVNEDDPMRRVLEILEVKVPTFDYAAIEKIEKRVEDGTVVDKKRLLTAYELSIWINKWINGISTTNDKVVRAIWKRFSGASGDAMKIQELRIRINKLIEKESDEP